MNLSESIQDYLKAIYIIGKGESASTKQLADRLSVNPASVTGMLKKLSELNMVVHESYRGVRLTHAGRKVALEVVRHHRLIETYLAEALGYTWDEVHDEAEKLEHHISEEFEDRIAKILGDPQYDPHGDPIPSRDGKVPPVSRDRLADSDIGDRVIVRRVRTDNGTTLRFLKDNGIVLGTKLRIAARDEDAGTITVRTKRASVELKADVCKLIYVER